MITHHFFGWDGTRERTGRTQGELVSLFNSINRGQRRVRVMIYQVPAGINSFYDVRNHVPQVDGARLVFAFDAGGRGGA